MACGPREEPYHPNSNLIILLFLTELRILSNGSPKRAKEAKDTLTTTIFQTMTRKLSHGQRTGKGKIHQHFIMMKTGI